VIEVPADLEVVGDEADGTDEDAADAAFVQAGEMVDDVGPEPRLAGRRFALEREAPVVLGKTGALGDQSRCLEQLLLVGVSLGEDAGR
jgi:hypothetical protein